MIHDVPFKTKEAQLLHFQGNKYSANIMNLL